MRLGRLNLKAIERMSPGEQAEALALLREYEERRLWNPLEAYVPASCQSVHPGRPPGPGICTDDCLHASFHAAWHPLKAFFGGNRAGKTTTAIVDDLIQMSPRELLPDYLQAYKQWECPFYCRVMTPDMNRTMRPVIHQKLREWTPKDLLKGGSFDKSYDKSSECLRLECGCRFDFLSYEMDLDKFGGAALHRCHYDEEPPASIRKECLMRLIDYNGQEVLSMTPLKGLTWTFREVWKSTDPNVFKLKVSMHANPTLSGAARDRILGAVADEKERAAREFGDFMHESGLVYPMWRQMLVPFRRAGDFGRDIVVAIDPGVRYCGLTFVAYDEKGDSFTFAARKLEDAIVADYAAEISQVLVEYGLRFDDVEFVADPAAAERAKTDGTTVFDELASEGIYAAKGNNSLKAGVLEIRRRMRFATALIADPDQGGDTQALCDELEEYVIDVDEDSDDGEFRTVKMKDHCADSWRYNHMQRPWMPPDLPAREMEAGMPWWVATGPQKPRSGPDESSVMGSMA
jgi:phage terminase large subunit-like protein